MINLAADLGKFGLQIIILFLLGWSLTCAQPASDPVGEIVISSHRVQPSDAANSSPITVINSETIAASSATSLDQILNKQPAFGFQGVNGNQNDGGYGAAFVELRNLNFNRTLVLVDGRRFVLSGIKTDEAVDLNNIPLALIDHVEILRDGSEPKYGADAIAGAVNIVLKKDFEGISLDGMGGISGHGDGETETIQATLGHHWSSDNSVVVSIGQSHSDPIPQSSRSWSQGPISAEQVGADGAVRLLRGETATAGGHAVSANDVDALILAGGQYRDFNRSSDSYDFSKDRYLTAGQDRKIATILAHADLTDHMSAFSELSYALRNSDNLDPPATLGLAGTAKYPSGFVVPADNLFNIFHQDVTLQRVLTEIGDQTTHTEAITARAVVGLAGTALGGEWSLSINHGETHQTYSLANAVNLTKVFNTLSADPAVCIAAAGCVQADYFGPNSLTPAAANYIRYTDVARSAYRENQEQASFTFPAAQLPGGPWMATLGGEYRTEFGSTLPDPVTAAGDQAGSDSAATGGGYRSREAYFDTTLPLRKDLTLAAAIRYSSFDRFGEFPTWKTNLSWAPIGGLRFRATLGDARRVPAITEAFGGSTASFLPVQDPCDAVSGSLSNPVVAANCRKIGLSPQFAQSSSLLAVSNQGNPHLTPESSRNLTIGTVLTPASLADLAITADYYDIRLKNAIDSLSDADPNFIPNQCYASRNLSSPTCALITRIPSGPDAGQISKIVSPDENIGAIRTDGFDLGLTYRLKLGDSGQLSFDWQNSFLFDYLVQETPGSPTVQYAGTFASLVNSGSYSRYKTLLATSFEEGAWTYGWTTRYIDGAKVQGQDIALYAKAPGIFYQDLEVSWRRAPVVLRFGIDNLLDQRPPTLIDGLSNTNLSSYDVIGRFFYGKTTISF